MSNFWSGIIGVVVGGVLTIFGQWAKFYWETTAARRRDEKRKSILREMLCKPGPTGWRKMSTMSAVIGADREETARLLIDVGARGSETGNDVWAYLQNKPLPRSEDD